MSVLIPATPRSTTANSYLTVAEADTYFETRLYTDAWDNAAATPDAEGYTVEVDETHGHTNENGAGDATAVVDGSGTGSFTVGTKIKFASHSTTYTVTGTSVHSDLLHLDVSPVLSQDLTQGEAVTRLTANTKEKALIQASSMLDEYYNWFGTILDADQSMRFPRYGVYDRDGNIYDQEEIPQDLKDGTCELALRLLQGDTLTEPSLTAQGFSEVTLGPINVKVEASNVDDVIPDTVMSMLSHLGSPTAHATRGAKVVPLWRI